MKKNKDKDESAEVKTEKLQKVLAAAGMGSRRGIEKDIEQGEVRVNGRIAKLGDRVQEGDTVEYHGRKIKAQLQKQDQTRVILYNKPEGQICSRKDPEGRASVFDHLPRLNEGRWVAVGRLDINTSGALLFTNNGELANRLMHPSSNIDREYLVRIQGEVSDEMCQALVDGVELEDGVARFTDIVASPNNDEQEAKHSWFYCVVMEGRNREVRRLWEAVGVRVSRLKRVRYGNIFIPSHVRGGQWIELAPKEIAELSQSAGMETPLKVKNTRKTEESRQRHINKLRAKNQRRGRK